MCTYNTLSSMKGYMLLFKIRHILYRLSEHVYNAAAGKCQSVMETDRLLNINTDEHVQVNTDLLSDV